MELKARYLAGEGVQKQEYRALLTDAEGVIGTGEPSAISAFSRQCLQTFPVEKWRQSRSDNYRVLSTLLADVRGLRLIECDSGTNPHAVTVVADTEHRRDELRRGLVARDIYPAILWTNYGDRNDPDSLEEGLARRLLTLHCDARYTRADMRRVALMTKEIMAAYDQEASTNGA